VNPVKPPGTECAFSSTFNLARPEPSWPALRRLLKVRVKSPPVDGAANDELVRFLAEALGVTRSTGGVVAGHSGRRKTVRRSGNQRVDADGGWGSRGIDALAMIGGPGQSIVAICADCGHVK
jgi:uncharacterized protein (TIGR00251 family)